MTVGMLDIREAVRGDVPLLYKLYDKIGKKDDGYFEHAFDQGVVILIASDKGKECGFCLLNYTPRYSLYKRLGVPEIQDLNVTPLQRRKGIATALIGWCEGHARSKGCEQIGISVGLFKDYGPAQILYIKLGYVPDGNGITCDREAVKPYASYLIDDDLSLMLLKQL